MQDENQTNTPTAALSVIDEAKKVRDEIKAENDRREKIIAAEQATRAEQLLSGAGAITVVTPKVETPKEYAEKVMNNKVVLK